MVIVLPAFPLLYIFFSNSIWFLKLIYYTVTFFFPFLIFFLFLSLILSFILDSTVADGAIFMIYGLVLKTTAQMAHAGGVIATRKIYWMDVFVYDNEYAGIIRFKNCNRNFQILPTSIRSDI